MDSGLAPSWLGYVFGEALTGGSAEVKTLVYSRGTRGKEHEAMKRLLVAVALTTLAVEAGFGAVRDANTVVDPALFQALHYRFLGPYRGGRASTIAGIPDQPHTFFLGTSGGVFKTVNAGESWENISDGFFATSSIGAVAVAPSDDDVLYVGTGEATMRANISFGVGLYKSTDGGKTWARSGLEDVGQIGRIVVDPRSPDRVYVAAVGHAFGPNEERGVFRSEDGGATWKKILYVSRKTGVWDLAMDPHNRRVLYATAWTSERKPWTIISGSDEGGLYKTTDGGDHWTKLEGGLPTGIVGKIGIALSPADSSRLWALVEAEEGGLFRSDDAGASWKRLETNQRRRLFQRSWYYMRVAADPVNRNKLYVLNVDSFESVDGGETFEEITTLPHGDGHDFWINPRDPRILAMAFDGGGTVSLDGGRVWSTVDNQPTPEIYYVTVDDEFPYNVYGAQQDNSTIRLPSRYGRSLSPYRFWQDVGGCEDGQIAVDPRNVDVVYAGCYGGEITRRDLATGERRQIMAYAEMEVGLAPKDLRYRFNWNAPIRLSPHDPDVLYHASQFVHRSTNGGESWEVISPDLSRDDEEKEDYSGAPITKENTGVEVYANILAFEESPLEAGVLWAGSDDGRVHVSRDAGGHWTEVTPEAMPEWGSVQMIELSPHAPGRAFIAVLRYMFEDYHPYLFRTDDYGRSWTLLTDGSNGIPVGEPTRVVREDPRRKGLLYAGTEHGTFVSFDDGAHWQSLQLDLPVVAVTDVRVHHDDLVLSTKGRGFWILDDVTPLHELGTGVAMAPAHLFPPRDTYRTRMAMGTSAALRRGENPPDGAMIFYTLAEKPEGEVTLQLFDPEGKSIQTYSSEHEPKPHPSAIFMGRAGQTRLTKNAGMNRFVWDLRHPVVDVVPDAIVWGFTGGPRAVPGTYRATLTVGNWSESRTFRVVEDPRIETSQADLEEALGLMLEMRSSLNETYEGVRRVRRIRSQARELVSRMKEAGLETGELETAAESLAAKLTAIEEDLMQPKNSADQDVENFPTKLDAQLAYVYWLVDQADARPTEGQRSRYQDLKKDLAAVLDRLDALVAGDVAAFEALAREKGATPVLLPKRD
jgi:photosystem II stability/assembly factor-like uncharacterized protein